MKGAHLSKESRNVPRPPSPPPALPGSSTGVEEPSWSSGDPLGGSGTAAPWKQGSALQGERRFRSWSPVWSPSHRPSQGGKNLGRVTQKGASPGTRGRVWGGAGCKAALSWGSEWALEKDPELSCTRVLEPLCRASRWALHPVLCLVGWHLHVVLGMETWLV